MYNLLITIYLLTNITFLIIYHVQIVNKKVDDFQSMSILLHSVNRNVCCITAIFHRTHRFVSTSPVVHQANTQNKSISKSSDNNSQVSTTFAQKAKENVKTGGYSLVVTGGLGLIVVVIGTIFKVVHIGCPRRIAKI